MDLLQPGAVLIPGECKGGTKPWALGLCILYIRLHGCWVDSMNPQIVEQEMQPSLRRSFLSWSIHDPYVVLEAFCLLTACLFWSVWESISAPLLISSSQPESHPDHRNLGTSPLLSPASQLSNTELLCLPLSSTNLPPLLSTQSLGSSWFQLLFLL